MVGLNERTFRRSQQAAVALYPLAILVALVFSMVNMPDSAIGGDFLVLFVLALAVVPAAFVSALLVLIVNGVHAVTDGAADRISVMIAAVMAASLVPSMGFPIGMMTEWSVGGSFITFGGIPDALAFFIASVGLVLCPIALGLHVFGSSPWRSGLRKLHSGESGSSG